MDKKEQFKKCKYCGVILFDRKVVRHLKQRKRIKNTHLINSHPEIITLQTEQLKQNIVKEQICKEARRVREEQEETIRKSHLWIKEHTTDKIDHTPIFVKNLLKKYPDLKICPNNYFTKTQLKGKIGEFVGYLYYKSGGGGWLTTNLYKNEE